MNQPFIYSSICAVAAGLLIELFFQIIKYKDPQGTAPQRSVMDYGALVKVGSYLSVSQYITLGNRRWVKYLLFRSMPPLIIFILLCGVLTRYFPSNSYLLYVLMAAIISLIFRDILQLYRARLTSEKLMHTANIVLILVAAYTANTLASHVNLSFAAPSIEGLVDNLWSSLLVAMVVLLYLQATYMGDYQNRPGHEHSIDDYVLRSYNQIRLKYSRTIDEACVHHQCSKALLYSVLIYESMNRPAWLRILENILVRIPWLHLTVGIAQVRSAKPLTDEDSIRMAAKILKGSAERENFQPKDSLNAYNKDQQYHESIGMILNNLQMHTGEVN